MRQLLTLTWPVIVSRSTQVMVGLADALMVARLGEASMAFLLAYHVPLATVLWLRLRSGAWRRIALVPEVPPTA